MILDHIKISYIQKKRIYAKIIKGGVGTGVNEGDKGMVKTVTGA